MEFMLDEAPRLERLKARRAHCVCRYCGHELEIKQVVFSELDDARTELFCPHCQKLDCGVEKLVFDNARYFVEEKKLNMFPDMDDGQMSQRMTIARTAETMSWAMQGFGALSEEGFAQGVDPGDAVPSNQLDLSAEEVDAIDSASIAIEDVLAQHVSPDDIDGQIIAVGMYDD